MIEALHLGDVFRTLSAVQAFALMLVFLLARERDVTPGVRPVRFGIAFLLATWTYGAVDLIGNPAILRPAVGLAGVTVLSWGVIVMLLADRRNPP